MLSLLLVATAAAAGAASAAGKYEQLTKACGNALPIGGNHPVSSVGVCEGLCDAQAAAAPGTGEAACRGVDTDGKQCYLKSECDGTPGACKSSMCGYRSLRPGPPAPSPAPPVPPSPPGMTLRGAGKTHGVFIGAASQAHLLTSDAKYTQLLKGQYSLTTAENGCKVGPIHPQRGNYTWEQCDQVFATAEAAGQAVRGHNLCWHTENPGWLNNGNFTPAELSEILQEHITTVVKHYGTRAYCWDVVNEAIYDGNNASQFLKPSYPWFPAVPDYIDTAFKAARAADPTHKVKLFYNEYSAEGMTPKSDKVYALVKDMRERNIPIDGVGLQMHIGLDTYQESPAFLADVAKNMARLHELSLEVHITEMDIKCVSKGSSKKCTPERLLRQAKLYADLLRVCLDAPNCKSFETWDFVDKYSWIGESIEPLPFSSDYVAKPAVAAMINEMLKKH